MRGSIDQSDLLALIEDALPADEAAAWRERLRYRPDVLRSLEQMRADRMALASDPEPVLERDLVEELEGILAKPMLLSADSYAHAPGAYRARHARSRRWPSIAVAAGLMLVASASLVALALNLTTESTDDTTIARNDGAPLSDEAVAMPAPPPAGNAVARGLIHHWGAAPASIDQRGGAPNANSARIAVALEQKQLASGSSAYASPFLLHVADDGALSQLSSLVTDVGTASLVRNFSYEEARQVWNEMVAATDWPDDRRREALASIRGSELARPLSSRERTQVHRVAGATKRELGEHLAGDRLYEAPPEWQLASEQSGRSYSVTLRVRDVPLVLDRLAQLAGPSVMLLSADGGESQASAADAWGRWKAWREAVESLRSAIDGLDREAFLVVPIELER